ncbi:MAG: 50S ribosomal protein L25 [Treponema sp.]|nr:50S ribosomal protein L25 [Treponema sp.]
MDLIINAKTRSTTGRANARRLRAQGRIPAVLYNSEGKSTMLDIDEVEFNKIWRSVTPSTLINVTVDGTSHDVFIKDAEYNIRNDKVLHADFFEPAADQAITMKMPVHLVGTPAGVLKGGFLLKQAPEVQIKAVAKKMPARVDADISGVNIGEKFLVKNLNLGDGVTVITDAEVALASVKPAR